MRDAISQKMRFPSRFSQWPDDIICERRVEILPKWQDEVRDFIGQFQTDRSLIAAHF
jgi:hypothetical protein